MRARHRRIHGASLGMVVGAVAVASFVACSGDDAGAPEPTDAAAPDAAVGSDAEARSAEGGPGATGGDDAGESRDAAPGLGASDATTFEAGIECSAAALVTSTHRYELLDGGDGGGAVYGGWGAHLGHLLRSATNDEWFVDDTGNDVEVNAGLAYFEKTGATWSRVGTNAFPALVQQNTGSVMAASQIFTYGVEPASQKIAECTFDTAHKASGGCTELPFATGQLSNYVGATIAKDGTKVVWWTNTTGSFQYIYDFGGGWNGPVVSALPGYADFSYVFARLAPDDSHLVLFGSAAHMQGGSVGGYDAVLASTTLGTPIANWANLATDSNAQETWLDPLGGAHFFAFTAGAAAAPLYFYQAKGGATTSGPSPSEMGVVSARIVETSTTANLVLSFADGSVRRKAIALADVTGAIDWNAHPSVDVAVPPSLGSPTLYPESRMYQTNDPEPGFAMNGLTEQGNVFQVGCE